tara:strand:- start:4831 stop:5097 length:267 start_codon:yes stop_codon:yes gene_type:complete
MSGWVTRYNDYVNMTIAELKELLKAKGSPVSGKKKDLIQYLIFDEYPSVFNFKLDTSIPRVGTGTWLEDKWKQSINYIFYAAINRQEI